MSVTVDGAVTRTVLPGLMPGKTYQVTLTAVRGLDESNPTTDTVTTGGQYHPRLSSSLHTTNIILFTKIILGSLALKSVSLILSYLPLLRT